MSLDSPNVVRVGSGADAGAKEVEMSTRTEGEATALLVVDVQNDVMGAAWNSDAVIGRIAGLVNRGGNPWRVRSGSGNVASGRARTTPEFR